jgi:hypothetical protein
MRKKHRKTLERVFQKPEQSGINWNDIEALFVALEATVSERAGSRVAVLLNDRVAIFIGRIQRRKRTRVPLNQ